MSERRNDMKGSGKTMFGPLFKYNWLERKAVNVEVAGGGCGINRDLFAFPREH